MRTILLNLPCQECGAAPDEPCSWSCMGILGEVCQEQPEEEPLDQDHDLDAPPLADDDF